MIMAVVLRAGRQAAKSGCKKKKSEGRPMQWSRQEWCWLGPVVESGEDGEKEREFKGCFEVRIDKHWWWVVHRRAGEGGVQDDSRLFVLASGRLEVPVAKIVKQEEETCSDGGRSEKF